jgi:hypothetical protein
MCLRGLSRIHDTTGGVEIMLRYDNVNTYIYICIYNHMDIYINTFRYMSMRRLEGT